MFSSVSVINSLARWCDPFTVTGQHSCAYTLPLKVFSVYICLYVCVPQCVTGCAYPWLCLSLSLRPNGGCQTIELELCPRVSLLATSCHFLPLKNCNRIAEILLKRALRGKDQRWCSNLKCTNAPPAQQTLLYNHQTWSPVETLGPKIGAGKVLWDSNNCTSRYSNCSYNQTRKPKLHSESIDWRTWSVAQSERQSTPVEARQWAGGQKVNENYWDQKGTTETSWELLRRLEENGGGDRLLITM